jgi:hypothetical protein
MTAETSRHIRHNSRRYTVLLCEVMKKDESPWSNHACFSSNTYAALTGTAIILTQNCAIPLAFCSAQTDATTLARGIPTYFQPVLQSGSLQRKGP